MGIIENTRNAIHAHTRISKAYRITKHYSGKVTRMDVLLSPILRSKLENAVPRRECRLNRKHPVRRQLLKDLQLLRLSEAARRIIATYGKDHSYRSALTKIVSAIDSQSHTVTVDLQGTIHTTISSLARKVRAGLTFSGDELVECDVAHMHHCILPRLIVNRVAYLRKEHADFDSSEYETEGSRLIELLSNGDYYEKWCDGPANREKREKMKDLMNRLLNMKNSDSAGFSLMRKMRERLPLLCGIIGDLKRLDHRILSKHLQRYTSDAINCALLQIQGLEIPAIPITDAILCHRANRELVCEIIGKQVHEVSGGVFCMVDGIRYAPSDLSGVVTFRQ